MFLRTEPLSREEEELFAALLDKGVSLQIVMFEDLDGKSEYPIYLAIFNGRPCHFHYSHKDEHTLNATISDVWRFLTK
ncbi:hypothetical protein D1013_08770 [Euzebyella marina]|uniref:Uncharacterized protein n=1 Tax=Euzebyella marina TaxID=1761453 RepID=A0A3G2L5G6_9FLAO|nr:hypothetical protein [Euzebyella marina]AYN67446.1 hypothetical protein D1013_08770 [Euzebyella marina]